MTPSARPYFGYGIYPNVYNALEVERLINASGPTEGELVLRNGQKPKKVAIVHCVGSRDENTNRWCSRVCCLYSLKLAHLIKEHTEAEVYNFYIDMRTPGKSMEEFYNRIAEEGVHLIRGKVADVYPDPNDGTTGRLVVQAEDTLTNKILKIPVDMVVLARRAGAACGFRGPAAPVQPELQQRRLVPGAPPEAGAGEHLHRRHLPGRLLPGAEGHPGLGGPGRRGRGRGLGAD